tara:strand:- start:736 stop:1263 length:528 start_codon:yes stop_codon:yes gene_type:complete
MPLMRELGILWQTGAISASHEHFLTNLIKQKLHLQTEYLQRNKNLFSENPTFVLFLPENEIHELGILYLNYLILSKGHKTIFLGQSLQISSLETLYSYDTKFNFVSYITVEPNKEDIMLYLKNFYKYILDQKDSKLLLFGPQQIAIDTDNLPAQIELYRSVESFVSKYFPEKVFV